MQRVEKGQLSPAFLRTRATFCTCLLKDEELRESLYPSSPTPMGSLASNSGDVALRPWFPLPAPSSLGATHPYEPLVVLFCIAALQTQLLSPLSRPQRVLSGKLVPSQCAETIIASKGNFAEAMILPSTPGQVIGGLEPESAAGGYSPFSLSILDVTDSDTERARI
jgi:hypothetical protein